nr:hypothetical protein CFP56_52909 [Quercus suber]
MCANAPAFRVFFRKFIVSPVQRHSYLSSRTKSQLSAQDQDDVALRRATSNSSTLNRLHSLEFDDEIDPQLTVTKTGKVVFTPQDNVPKTPAEELVRTPLDYEAYNMRTIETSRQMVAARRSAQHDRRSGSSPRAARQSSETTHAAWSTPDSAYAGFSQRQFNNKCDCIPIQLFVNQIGHLKSSTRSSCYGARTVAMPTRISTAPKCVCLPLRGMRFRVLAIDRYASTAGCSEPFLESSRHNTTKTRTSRPEMELCDTRQTGVAHASFQLEQ